MATNVHLTPELESFARFCVESGRYSNVSEVVRSALRLLQEGEERNARFNAMLDAVRLEAERNGVYEAADVLAEVDGIIAQSPQ
ncbi:MAG: type II toxin-antitoxin system ParD family antitoxin [Magnetococcales bacterium]|nr:type II toxin-antitoxin system ParD family antitoxin [Magnetococcales bacterium]MBF0418969.1 type II toxin-antitoxin system ParD family antitoxin [Magnetococcales bacterium]MBF0435833.1 type II toxin-antitoxin system ParD family antitoxin [Magnetococcales bacterium]